MPRTVLTIGNFDGAHIGHAALVARARTIAGIDGRAVALVFDPHPLTRLRPATAPGRLSTFEQRSRWLCALGAAEAVRLEPTDDLLSTPAEDFCRLLAREFSPTAIVEGPDFRFGKGRTGDLPLMSRMGADLGFRLEVVGPVVGMLDDHSIVTASSTIVRWLLGNGRVRDAARILGRPYEMAGIVVRGDRRGRTIGFPTANLTSPCLAPADGVYAGLAELPDSRRLAAAISIGTKPTFDGAARTVEAWFPEAAADDGGAIQGLAEYGWELRLEFHAWIRDQVRFESAGALVDQLHRDAVRVGELLECDGGRGVHTCR